MFGHRRRIDRRGEIGIEIDMSKSMVSQPAIAVCIESRSSRSPTKTSAPMSRKACARSSSRRTDRALDGSRQIGSLAPNSVFTRRAAVTFRRVTVFIEGRHALGHNPGHNFPTINLRVSFLSGGRPFAGNRDRFDSGQAHHSKQTTYARSIRRRNRLRLRGGCVRL